MNKHFIQKATSLEYNQEKDNAPRVTSYGIGNNAKKIIQIAKENDILIKKDEDLLNMLSVIELNQEIPTELYKAVGEIFGYVYNLTNKENEKTNIN
jgi:flagellar biosynthesis protein